jgi:hypothetical protein
MSWRQKIELWLALGFILALARMNRQPQLCSNRGR